MNRLVASLVMTVIVSACANVKIVGPNSWDHALKRCETVGRWDDGAKLRIAGYERMPDLTNTQYWDMVALWKKQTGDLAQPEYFFLFEHPQQVGKTHIVAVSRGCILHEETVDRVPLRQHLKLQDA